MTRNDRRRRDAVLRNPSVAGAMAFWPWDLAGKPEKPDVPLAGWLAEHGYRETIDTPRMRQ